MELTNNQLIHRQYLQSDLWFSKRQEALDQYGCICNRCGSHGTDVHHKTYERVGGFELLEDLEVLCRGCHEAHHAAERCMKTHKKAEIKGINQQLIYRILNRKQKEKLIKKYNLAGDSDLYLKLSFEGNIKIVYHAIRFLGYDYFYKQRDRIPKNSKQLKSYIAYTDYKQRI